MSRNFRTIFLPPACNVCHYVDMNKILMKKLVGWLCWGLTSQSTILQSCRDGAIASWVINQYFRGVKCLAQGHNTAAVGLEPRTSRSGVRHSTTEPPRSPEKVGILRNKLLFLSILWMCKLRRITHKFTIKSLKPSSGVTLTVWEFFAGVYIHIDKIHKNKTLSYIYIFFFFFFFFFVLHFHEHIGIIMFRTDQCRSL